MKRLPLQRGMTLLELMMVITVVGIMLALAVPAFNTLVNTNRSQAQSGKLLTALNYARSEAVRRATSVRVTSLNGTDWEDGWRIWIDTNSNGAYNSGTDTELQLYPALTGGATLTGSAGELVFASTGYLTGSGFTFATVVSFDYAMDSTAAYCIKAIYAGRVSLQKNAC